MLKLENITFYCINFATVNIKFVIYFYGLLFLASHLGGLF
ncbi:hypothetical protein SALWKB12_0451 [Snodgrassella communis]|jgi:hypothetical protein|uniref:Uncharacterized protein n=1 Tax=Snodgrassella communis TaxID=2946699 RepID=A0A836MSI1_9NEIS|nr:hypothetical protein SALWKB12_0451 [Snodgrassella communis]KDN15884.1 hypothetical protein SALWKB29_0303 [Snodgrassella communis]